MNTQKDISPAVVYDKKFVPALFRHWGETLTKLVELQPQHEVLDVACGTGAFACTARALAGAKITGIDPNPEMLTVAREKDSSIDWHQGRAEALPFEHNRFDTVVSQFGFMFFEDRVQALREMWRVVKPGGHLAVAVCDALDHSPGYSVLTELLHRLFGEQVAAAMRAPFNCGDKTYLQQCCRSAGIEARIERHDGPVEFDSIEALVSCERACVWTLGGLLNETQFDRLAEAAGESLQPYVNTRGKVEFNMPTLIIRAGK